MSQFMALLIKELKEAFRDKRALMVALSMSILMPIMIMVMSQLTISQAVDDPPIYVKFTGAEFSPKLIKAFETDNILSFAVVPENERRNWNERHIAIAIPDTFGQDMHNGKTIDIVLQADFQDKSLMSPLRRINNVVSNYARTIAYQRLLVRGIDLQLLKVVNVEQQDTSPPSNEAMMISLMLGIYLMLSAFLSGAPISIDSSAGERERNVLELLLCQPVSTLKIVLAKLICSSTIAIIAIILMLVLTSIALGFVDLTKIGASFDISPWTFFELLLLLIPICFFASALQLFFAFKAKTFKEAQSTVNMLIMIPSFIPIAVMMMDDRPAWLAWLPISGHTLIMEGIFKGLATDWNALFYISLATCALTIGLVFILAKKLNSEKVVLSLS